MDDNTRPTFGQRLRLHRERSGKTRAVLGGLVGRSEGWVKGIESGRLLPPRLPMMIALAEALGITDLVDLIGDQSLPVAAVSKAAHPATPAVDEAMLRLSRRCDVDPATLDVAGRVERGWQLFLSSQASLATIGAVLPDLIGDARAAVRTLDEGVDRRKAHADLAQVYHLAQAFLAWTPSTELVWMAAARSMAAAEAADDTVAIATAVWYQGFLYRASNQLDLAEAVAAETAEMLDPDAGGEQLAMWGQMHLARALTHAEAGKVALAWRDWARADEVVQSLGSDYRLKDCTTIGPQLDILSVEMEADLCHPGEAIRRCDAIDLAALPFCDYRAMLLMDTARAHYQRREYAAVVYMLERAVRESVDITRRRPFTRQALLELSAQRGIVGSGARDLAVKIGVLA